MLEAIEQGLNQNNQAAAVPGQPRDDLGRFASKPADQPSANGQTPPPGEPEPAPGQQQIKPAEGLPGESADDLLKEPEGLGQKASERFQKLANTVKDLQQQVEQREQVISYVKETFQEHRIQPEQFEQAAQVIGALNRGDLESAERILTQQLQQIAIARGRPIAPVDALAEFPDLRQQVDGLMLTEEHALQLAQARMMQRNQQQATQQQQREQEQANQQRQQQDRAKQEVNTALQSIDSFTKEIASKDLDWPVIEAKLLPRIQGLLQGVPPAQWLNVVKTQYELIKDVSSGARQQQQTSAGQVLRPTGQASPAVAPRTMYDAMWAGK